MGLAAVTSPRMELATVLYSTIHLLIADVSKVYVVQAVKLDKSFSN